MIMMVEGRRNDGTQAAACQHEASGQRFVIASVEHLRQGNEAHLMVAVA